MEAHPKVAMPGCFGTVLIVVTALAFIGGNMFSYYPIDVLAPGIHNATIMAQWTADPDSAPFAFTCATYNTLLNLLGFLLLPCAAVIVHMSRDREAATWYAQYSNSFGQRAAMVVFYACVWGFCGHVVQLFVAQHCDVCTGIQGKVWPANSTIAKFYPSAFWMHAAPAGIIALLCPFQLTKKVREWNHFLAHRWIGRVVLLASCVNQTSATYLVISNLFFNRHNVFINSWWANTVYALGFVPFNIYSWTATIQGWRTVKQGRIIEHGAWMYRLCSMWVITMICFRAGNGVFSLIFGLFLGTELGTEWGTAVPVWGAFTLTIPVEIFLQRSGRFHWDKAVKAMEPKSMQCPFSDASDDPNVACPLTGKRNFPAATAPEF